DYLPPPLTTSCPGVCSDPPTCCFSLRVSPLCSPAVLESAQILIILVLMTVMLLVIGCLLNHYKLSACSFTTRQSQARRQAQHLQQVSTDVCLWPPDSGARQGASEVKTKCVCVCVSPSFMSRDRFSRFQPTYPYLTHDIHLPPTISLSDGEEPPPYQGPCTLQLRDPEQQLELNRESVRAPPNRTIFHRCTTKHNIINLLQLNTTLSTCYN
uniref:Prostate transmembrane protein, androgen induced 1 n=1 Tax=Oncorhynchus tshawytscha TaxID=74940 RepID=A0AAZ3PRU4_ONCTS